MIDPVADLQALQLFDGQQTQKMSVLILPVVAVTITVAPVVDITLAPVAQLVIVQLG